MEEERDEKNCTSQLREFETSKQYEENSNIVVQKYIDDLAETQKSIVLNDLIEDSEAARENVDGDIYNNSADKIEVQDDDEKEENEHIKMYEEDANNSSYEYEENEAEDGDKIHCVSISPIFELQFDLNNS